jgi:WD40 repeat protein
LLPKQLISMALHLALSSDFKFASGAVRCVSPSANTTLLIALQAKVLNLLTKRWGATSLAGTSDASSVTEALHHTSEAVYDAQFMSIGGASAAPAIAVTCKHEAIRLLETSGAERAQYRGYNALDEPMSAVALSVCNDSALIAGGYNCATGHILLFDVARPGREPVAAMRTRRHRKCPRGQKGLLSTLAICPASGGKLIAAGSFSGSTWLYDVRDGSAVGSLKKKGPRGGRAAPGVTQLTWSPNDGGQFLYAGFRNAGTAAHPGDDSDGILAWDTRRPDRPVCRYWRDCTSSQRVGFDLDASGTVLATGSRDGRLLFYDAATAAPTAIIDGFPDAVNSVALDPWGRFFAVSTGQRHDIERLAWHSDSDDENPSRQHRKQDGFHAIHSSGGVACAGSGTQVDGVATGVGVDPPPAIIPTEVRPQCLSQPACCADREAALSHDTASGLSRPSEDTTTALACDANIHASSAPTASATPVHYKVPDVWGGGIDSGASQRAGAMAPRVRFATHKGATTAAGPAGAAMAVESAVPADTDAAHPSVTMWAWGPAIESSSAVAAPHT